MTGTLQTEVRGVVTAASRRRDLQEVSTDQASPVEQAALYDALLPGPPQCAAICGFG